MARPYAVRLATDGDGGFKESCCRFASRHNSCRIARRQVKRGSFVKGRRLMKISGPIAVFVVCGLAAAASAQTSVRCDPIVIPARNTLGCAGRYPQSPASTARLVAVRHTAPASANPAPLWSSAPLGSAAITTAAPQTHSGCCSPCAPAPQSCYLPAARVAGGGAPYVAFRPVVPLVAMPSAYYVGRGIFGQPKVYVPGQPVRNALRWLTP